MPQRNTFFDYEKRIGKGYHCLQNDEGVELLYAGVYVAWDSELYNDDGSHYHVWISKGLTKEEKDKFLQECESAARAMGDVVVFTYDYIPEPQSVDFMRTA